MRKRGYIVFAAVVAAAVLLLFLLPKQQPQPAAAAVSDSAESLLSGTLQHPSRTTFPRDEYRRSYASSSSRGENSSRPAASAVESSVSAAAPSVRNSRRTHVGLNGGDTLDWQQLYNIGPAFARRIVNYRTRLGGFVSKEQLMEVYGMDSARYLSIVPYIDIDSTGVEQMDINIATIDQLKHHPYLDYYQAKAIVRLREKEGAYHSVADLRKVPVIDQETFTKILPYITCNSQPNR